MPDICKVTKSLLTQSKKSRFIKLSSNHAKPKMTQEAEVHSEAMGGSIGSELEGVHGCAKEGRGCQGMEQSGVCSS